VVIAASIVACGVGLGWVSVQLPEKSLFATGYEALDAQDLTTIRDTILKEIPTADRGSLEVIVKQLGSGIYPRAASQIFASAAARTPEEAARIHDLVYSLTTPVHTGYAAGEGLRAPAWLQSETWAKPAIILMGVWLGIGGGNMLLYLAGLSNIPPELYEAAAIDGATGWQRFIHVTWPQLAPTTFFIVIMSTIGGLQGGFEQVMIMTEGKYDTIVLTYFQYVVAFKDRADLGLACAIAWIMFAMIFVMTAFNFRVGSQMTNE
jgi:ABC-type sugar transport system permease subunit